LDTYSFLELSLDLSDDVLPVSQKPVQPQEGPANRFLIPAWHVVFFVIIEVWKEEVMHDVLCRKLGFCENKSNRDFSVESAGAASATPGSNTEAILVDCAATTRLCQLL
jgi:hypothetical protein